MATRVIASIDGARLEADFDETSDPLNPDLTVVRCVNSLGVPVHVMFRRSSRQPWFSVEVPAGETRSQATGGPVRRWDDLPQMSLRT